jgi:hypothetical protein
MFKTATHVVRSRRRRACAGGDSASEDDDRVKEKEEPAKGQANKQEYHVARSEPRTSVRRNAR